MVHFNGISFSAGIPFSVTIFNRVLPAVYPISKSGGATVDNVGLKNVLTSLLSKPIRKKSLSLPIVTEQKVALTDLLNGEVSPVGT